MKHCPTCKVNYADDTLQYCLEDGTPLTALSMSQMPTVALDETSAETILKGSEPAPTQVAVPPTEAWQPQQSEVTRVSPQHQPQQFQFQAQPPVQSAQPARSNTSTAVVLTVIIMLFLFGGILGAWLILRDRNPVAANNANNARPTASTTPSGSVSPTPTANANANANANSNTTTPTPYIDTSKIKSEVSDKMYAWKASMESGSLDAVMSHYASRLNYYYRSGGMSAGAVRSDKKRAFDIYYSFSVSISNMNISLNADGDVATVTFTKSWNFRGTARDSNGSVRAQFQVSKIGGSWYITGEKDL